MFMHMFFSYRRAVRWQKPKLKIYTNSMLEIKTGGSLVQRMGPDLKQDISLLDRLHKLPSPCPITKPCFKNKETNKHALLLIRWIMYRDGDRLVRTVWEILGAVYLVNSSLSDTCHDLQLSDLNIWPQMSKALSTQPSQFSCVWLDSPCIPELMCIQQAVILQ